MHSKSSYLRWCGSLVPHYLTVSFVEVALEVGWDEYAASTHESLQQQVARKPEATKPITVRFEGLMGQPYSISIDA